jgi:aspartate-semialdehyde dehydrogenase
MHERAVAKVEEQVADALARGARLPHRRQAPQAGPLVLRADAADRCATGCTDHARGNLRAGRGRHAFDTEEEVIARANDTEYGLVAYVVTKNGARQMRSAARSNTAWSPSTA